MDYRTLLKQQFTRRQELNPRYSLRAFAKKIDLAPSKVSEVFSGKKSLSVPRLEDIADRLDMSPLEKELMTLSALAESSSHELDRTALKGQVHELNLQLNAGKTSQRNAWYFGAINVLEMAGYEARILPKLLGITSLQVENAKRFIKRIAKIYPERKEILLEPSSILRKVEEHFYSDPLQAIEANFLLLTAKERKEIEAKIKTILKAYSPKAKKQASEDLHMVYWGILKVNKE